jgi:hypothetical protein
MKFGTIVTIRRGGGRPWAGEPGSTRLVKGVLIGRKGFESIVRLLEDDPLDTIGLNTKGQVGRWSSSVVEAVK